MNRRQSLPARQRRLRAADAAAFERLVRTTPEADIVRAFEGTPAMVTVVVVSSLVGMSLPFLLARLKLDPATASGPLVTTIADAAGVVI